MSSAKTTSLPSPRPIRTRSAADSWLLPTDCPLVTWSLIIVSFFYLESTAGARAEAEGDLDDGVIRLEDARVAGRLVRVDDLLEGGGGVEVAGGREVIDRFDE